MRVGHKCAVEGVFAMKRAYKEKKISVFKPLDGDIPLIILFESDGACVKSSECRDKICVNTGKLTRAGQMAICLPARVTLELQSVEGTENTPDAITG